MYNIHNKGILSKKLSHFWCEFSYYWNIFKILVKWGQLWLKNLQPRITSLTTMVALFCRERRRRRWCRSRWKRGACCCRRAPKRGCAPSRTTTTTTYRRSEAAEEDRCCSAAASSKEPPYWSFFEAGYVEAASCSHPRNFFLRSTPCISCRPTGKGNSSFSLLRSRRRIDLVPRKDLLVKWLRKLIIMAMSMMNVKPIVKKK